MFSAQDARERTDTFLKEEKRKAEEQITAAIKRGEHKCTLDFSPSKALTDWLRFLGYEVTCIVFGSADPFKNRGDSSSRTIEFTDDDGTFGSIVFNNGYHGSRRNHGGDSSSHTIVEW